MPSIALRLGWGKKVGGHGLDHHRNQRKDDLGVMGKHWEKLKGKQLLERRHHPCWRHTWPSFTKGETCKVWHGDLGQNMAKDRLFSEEKDSWWWSCYHTKYLWNDCLFKGINLFIFLEELKGKLTLLGIFMVDIKVEKVLYTRYWANLSPTSCSHYKTGRLYC